MCDLLPAGPHLSQTPRTFSLASGSAESAAIALKPTARVAWDGQTLRLVRDLFGGQPLWFTASSEGLTATTRLPALLDFLSPRRAINRDRLAAFLSWRGDDGDQDFFSGVRRLPPGCALHWRSGALPRMRWWSGWPSASALERDPEVTPALRDAIASLTAGRRAAVALSGGIDSSLVALAGIQQREPITRAASIVSARFPSFDERAQLTEIEAALGLHVARWSVDEHWPMRAPERYQQTPSLGPQAHPGAGFLVPFFEAQREALGVTHFLTGVGGDQLFSATRDALLRWRWSHRELRALLTMLPARRRDALLTIARLVAPERLRRALRPLYARRHEGSLPPWRRPHLWLTPDATRRVPSPLTLDAPPPESLRWVMGWTWEEASRVLQAVSYASRVTLLHPLLTRDVLALALASTPAQRRSGSLDKWPLRRALTARLPPSITHREKLGTFDEVVEFGLASGGRATIEALFSDARLHDLGLIDAGRFIDVMRRYRARVESRGRGGAGTSSIHLWRTISAELWLRALEEWEA